MRLLAVDPGVVTPGLAWFDNGVLNAATYKRGKGFADGFQNLVDLVSECADWVGIADQVVMEWPQIYGGRRAGGKKDPNSMLPLAAFNGALAFEMVGRAGWGAKVAFGIYKPHDWKGSKAKNPMARVILSRLTPDERPYLSAGTDFYAALAAAELKGVECKHPYMNAIDAIGIGLHHLGRLKVGGPVRRRVVHRE